MEAMEGVVQVARAAPVVTRRPRNRRSSAGLTTKIQLATDSSCRPLCLVLTPSQARDARAFDHVLACIRIPRRCGGPRTRLSWCADLLGAPGLLRP